jgi:hypothetical protein
MAGLVLVAPTEGKLAERVDGRAQRAGRVPEEA